MLEFRSFLHWRDAATEQHSCSDQETKKAHHSALSYKSPILPAVTGKKNTKQRRLVAEN
jgi:hypothetical protein